MDPSWRRSQDTRADVLRTLTPAVTLSSWQLRGGFKDFRMNRRARITMYVVFVIFGPLTVWLLVSDDGPSSRLWLAGFVLFPLLAVGLVLDAVQRRQRGEPPEQ